ncbi:oligosaccharide flippase family protein [Vibrio splendidus]|uniref:oligosaccharide flippase family protein n=1 Tax=Vibrio splendidus TaxID=29497 RepID=UPI000C82806F|nr:oligosaccharide flippase family protein [Vibrio splendidus]PMO71087.1 hypothetical protein BCT03_20265 [Vibrio splendidus]
MLKKNIFSNVSETAINILAPLVVIPQIISSLGVDAYGHYVVLVAEAAIYVVILEFGFGMFFSKQASIFREDRKLINNLLWIFISVRCVLSILVYTCLSAFSGHSQDQVIILSILVSSQLLNISPIISGLEMYSTMARLQLISKVLMVLMVFMTDFDVLGVEKALIIQALTWTFLTGSLLFVYVRKYGLYNYSASPKYIINVFQASLPYYGAKLLVNLYQQASTYFVSFFLVAELVAVYSVSIQLYKVGQAIIGAVAKVVYTTTVKTKNFLVVKNATKVSLCIHLFFLPIVVFFGESLLEIIFPMDVKTLYTTSLLLYISLFFVIVSAYFGYPVMSAINKDNYGHLGILFSSVSYMISFFVIYKFNMIGIYSVVCCILVADFVGMIVRFYYVCKFNVLKV